MQEQYDTDEVRYPPNRKPFRSSHVIHISVMSCCRMDIGRVNGFAGQAIYER